MMKHLALLGSTGSIGTQTLQVVEETGDFKVEALAAGSNIELLEKQIRKFKPQLAVVWNKDKALELEKAIADTATRVATGMDGLLEAVRLKEVDMVLTAVVGMIGILPTLEALEAGKDIALANKETLVTAGHLVMAKAKEKGRQIYPVDSEHSAIFQVLKAQDPQTISKILLTASGGPFRGRTIEQLQHVQVEDALKHPNWAMGRKITIDSSTMVNKGLEVMEAKWLFEVDFDQIEVVIQPQSIIHSMVEFNDGAVLAQLGTADMKLPIQYALYEAKRKFMGGKRLDFKTLKQITFEEPDMETFRGLKLAYQAGKLGGSMPTVYNAANEWAVARFLDKKIGYLDIIRIIEESMEHHTLIENPTVESILAVENETYQFIESRWNR
ncbi:1-deoxy-D-xylulose 5-phosphate reductoisomerase [Lachnospiraceae bacterium TWA4]|nr:1-deoxy-D-xylulose 5-phosphate reductoisomerase [Lachnospiraceae bacterium TWA4]